MKKKDSNQTLFAVLPYLPTSHPFYVRGIVFRNSNDQTQLSAENRKHLKQIVSMFVVGKNRQIQELTYTYLELTDDKMRNAELIQRLREAHTLISYLESAPHLRMGHPLRDLEDLALYIFMPDRFPKIILWDSHNRGSTETGSNKPARRTVSGFDCVINWNTRIYIDKTYRLNPQSIEVLSYGDVSSDLEAYAEQSSNWAMMRLMHARDPHLAETESRVLTALRWYTLSTARTIEEDRRLVYLAIAFESLLGLEHTESVTKRFKETVSILLGSIPRLEGWLDQFYNARSEIVHEGRSDSLMFYTQQVQKKKEGSKENRDKLGIPYRPLTDYGRRIFRLCVNSILSGATLAKEIELSTLMVHNQERLVNICKKLEGSKKTPAQKIESVRKEIQELGEYWLDSAEHTDMDTLVGTGKRVITTYLLTNPELSPEVKELMQAISQNPENLITREILELFKKLSAFNGRWKGTADETLDTGQLQYAVYLFVEYAAKPHRLWDW